MGNLGTASVSELRDDTGLGETTVRDNLNKLHEGGRVKRIDADETEAEATGSKVLWQIIVPDKPVKPEHAGERYGKGELREKVKAALDASTDEDMSPHQIAKIVAPDRVSPRDTISGSIKHACEVLVNRGEATRTSEKPKRYRSGV